MIAGHQARPLALWGLVSANVFVERGTPDFYLGLTPFFEPFIQDHDGKVFDLLALKEYAERALKLPLTDDICELFIVRMEKVGWLQVLADDSGAKIYRCRFSGSTIDAKNYAEAEERLVRLVQGFRAYITDDEVGSLRDLSGEEIEEHFLSFLSHRAMSEYPESAESIETTQIEYWIAKYIGWLIQNDRPAFEFVQQISGVALLSEALMGTSKNSMPLGPVRVCCPDDMILGDGRWGSLDSLMRILG